MELEVISKQHNFYTPSQETIQVLNVSPWVCSFSGGKDSTSLVTWIEWLRRTGVVASCVKPQLVLSDTEVEYPFLQTVSEEMMARLTECGWECKVVRPLLHKKLYNSIFGRGLSPVSPKQRKKMRWCTQATKIDPMTRYSKELLGTNSIQLTGVRWGESKTRDGKLALGGCMAGGECGLPEPGEGRYGPIITWKTCQVLDWLQGGVEKAVREKISDLLAITRKLIKVYDLKYGLKGFGIYPRKVTALRFGCIGCPAVSIDKVMEKGIRENPQWKALRRIYGLWETARLHRNRLQKRFKSGEWRIGPIKMEVRKRLFEKLLKIQEESGVILVTAEDEAYIRNCWITGVYPKGWSAADEKE